MFVQSRAKAELWLTFFVTGRITLALTEELLAELSHISQIPKTFRRDVGRVYTAAALRVRCWVVLVLRCVSVVVLGVRL